MLRFARASSARSIRTLSSRSQSMHMYLLPSVLQRKQIYKASQVGSGGRLLPEVGANKVCLVGVKHINLKHYSVLHSHKPGNQTLAPELADGIARYILKRDFGYDGYRHEQAAAIRAILQGENTLVIFPTGAGKSLCYQIPAIALEELDRAGATEEQPGSATMGSGITIVISPLIALMKDQVDALRRRGIPADCLDSTKTNDEQRRINAQIQQGRLRLLYCTPERLNQEGFFEDMKHVPGSVRLVAVDEAHCISEWGHSFRPDYLKIARFVKEVKAERVVCLTATATPRVAEDVCKIFDIKESNVFTTSPYRPNLELQVEVINAGEEKFERLLRFVETHDGPTLVYVTAREQAEYLATRLSSWGYSAAYFHARLPTKKKVQTQEAFMEGSIRIMVATIAFGMGIDKPNIRNVLHYDVPSTVEEYSQQVGRAGRDGKPSSCMLYLCRDDFWVKESFARGDLPSRQSLQRLLEDVFSSNTAVKLSANGHKLINLSPLKLGEKHDMRPEFLGIILAKIELRFGLIRAITPEITTYRFEAYPEYSTWVKSDESREAQAIESHAEKLKNWHTINVNVIVKNSGLLRSDIVNKLNDYNDRGLIRLHTLGLINRYEVLQELPSTPEEIKQITDQLYAEMEDRERDAMNRFDTIRNLLTDSHCLARALARYFGMDLPSGKSQCGHCSYCLTGTPAVLPPERDPSVSLEDGIRRILAACDFRDDPRFLARLAFGIPSPRTKALRLYKTFMFGYLKDHSFESLLKEFTKACEGAEPHSRDKSN